MSLQIEIIKTEEGHSVRFKKKGQWKYISELTLTDYKRCLKCSCLEKMNLIQAIFGFDSSCNRTYKYNARENLTIEEAVQIKQDLENIYTDSLEAGTIVLKSKI